MKNFNQKGFSFLYVFLLVVIIGLISGTGYYLYTANKQAGDDLNKADQQYRDAQSRNFEKSGSSSADETKEWLLYTSPGKEFNVRLADGWVLERYQKYSSVYQLDNTKLALVEGVKAVVDEVQGGKDGGAGLFISYADQNLEQVVKTGTKQTSLKTNDGIEIEKYYGVTGEGEGIGPPTGSLEYNYFIYKGNNAVISVFYSVAPGATDYHELVEKVVKTVHFN
jgi:hypothetical protein